MILARPDDPQMMESVAAGPLCSVTAPGSPLGAVKHVTLAADTSLIKTPTVSAVVPIYNEAALLEESLRRLDAFLEKRFGPDGYEMIAVDDGSRDASRAILERLAPELGLVLDANPRNLGKGAAVKRGMLKARGRYVFFTDADLSTPLEELDRFLARIKEGADLVIGNRKSPEARIEVYQPWHRVVMGLAFTRLVNLVMRLRVSDYTCGFKCFTAEAARDIFTRARITGWAFDVEILYLARRRGYVVHEVPVHWADNPNSKVRLLRDTARSLAELMKIRCDALRGRYGERQAAPAGLRDKATTGKWS
ncbi:MAG: dolichyl-phosphate beta-glucosyltransferase [Planctomycetota bacterium]